MNKTARATDRDRAIVKALLPWFAKNARDLPWRRTTDPYAIWVSEIMLQQTQVKTVIPYWKRWMRVLPDIESLAAAKPEVIHKLWEGLGYYIRVGNLQRAARQIVEQHGGVFPSSYEEVLALPGIGRYTAGAICSIAFNRPTAILDGNVIRVLSRVYRVAGDARERQVNARLWRLAEGLVHAADQQQRLGDHRCSGLNQSLMELGALVCTPRNPACPACPLRRICEARQEGSIADFPQKRPRPRTQRRHAVAFIVRHGNKFLVRQRPPGAANGQLWEFPGGDLRGTTVDELARKTLGGSPSRLSRLLTVKHNITRYRITLDVREVQIGDGSWTAPGNSRWVTRAALDRLALPSAHRKIAAALAIRDHRGFACGGRVARH